jgi:hypothetical protein
MEKERRKNEVKSCEGRNEGHSQGSEIESK